jgi:HAD superfamily phosphoserine phosphatase-like hydrolase
MCMIKAVVLDIDGTLTHEVSWLKITELLGASVMQHEQIFELFLRNKLAYEEAKHQLVALWQATGNANKPYLSTMFDGWTLQDDAHELVNYLHRNNFITALITGSVDLFAQKLAEKLSIKNYYANTQLIFDDQQNLIDLHYERNQAQKKLEQFRLFMSDNDLAPSVCVVVGDSENDVELFKLTKQGIAVKGAKEELLAVAWKRVNTLLEIKVILEDATKR